MVNRHDQAVPLDQLLCQSAGEVGASAGSDDRRPRRTTVVSRAEGAVFEGFLRAIIVCSPVWSAKDDGVTRRRSPLTAKSRFAESVLIFLRASRSALSSI